MNFYIAAATDIGIKRKENQDNLFVEQYLCEAGKIVFAVLCDGMGGLEYGGFASESIVSAFANWAKKAFSETPKGILEDHVIREQWIALIDEQNDRIRSFGQRNHCQTGSTVTALLLTESRYYILNIGDSRAYELGESVARLTNDHTVLANEIRLGNLSEEQAKASPIQNVLTKCVGVKNQVYPDLFFGDTKDHTVYMLCSDGFRHHVTETEMLEYLIPQTDAYISWLKEANESLIELNKQRGETDNISVITIYTRLASDLPEQRG